MKEIEFNLDFENFYCPITGQQVLDPGQFNFSPAMVFAFLDDENVFEHLQKDLVEKFAQKFNDETRHLQLYQKLTEDVLITERNYLWITHGLIRTGSARFCFDIGYVDPEQENIKI